MYYAAVIVVLLTQFFLIKDIISKCHLPHPVSYVLVDLDYKYLNITHITLISGFTNYSKLIVNNQDIPMVCPEIFQLKMAVDDAEVYIKNSSVKDIDVGVYEFDGVLGILSITHNKIEKIKEGVFNEMKVKHINLSYNEIDWIEARAFDNNINLESVSLRGNKLRIINSNWFFNTSFLYRIDLGENRLWTLQGAAFKHLVNCSYMSFLLDNNKIEEIHASFLKGFRYITNIDLHNNKIALIPPQFVKNVMVYEVILHNNELQRLPLNFFQKYPDIIFLDLRKNKFSCQYLSAIKNYAIIQRRTVFASWEDCYNLEIGLKYSNWDVYDVH